MKVVTCVVPDMSTQVKLPNGTKSFYSQSKQHFTAAEDKVTAALTANGSGTNGKKMKAEDGDRATENGRVKLTAPFHVEDKEAALADPLCIQEITRTSPNQNSNLKRQQGFVARLKDNFGFIKTVNHDQEIFFHYSKLCGDIKNLELGDVVEYTLSKGKGNKVSAEKVTKVPVANVSEEDIDKRVMVGKVIRPLCNGDSTQTECHGLIEVKEDEEGKVQTFPFEIMGMANKADCVHQGEVVKFQICTVSQTGQKMACNVVPQRKGLVAFVKDKFGFIKYEVGKSKKLYFNIKEVQDGLQLKAGDEVEFSVVFNQHTGKCNACNVHRASKWTKPVTKRPNRLAYALKSNAVEDANNPRLVILRKPLGPDSPKGFNVKRKVCQPGVSLH